MMRRVVIAATVLTASLVLAGLGLGAGSAGTSTTKLRARLNNAQELPKPHANGGSGRFTATLTGHALKWTLRWKLTFTNLSGPPTEALLHLGKRGTVGPVGVGLCGPCTSGVHGKSLVPVNVMAALKTGGAYVNIHTAKNPNGEIRGQIRKVG